MDQQRFIKTTDLAVLPDLRKPSSRDARSVANRELPILNRTSSQGYPKLSKEVNNYVGPEELIVGGPFTEKHQNIPKEISKGISYLDIVSRMRDLEKKYIDLSGSMDRRVQAFIEENPQKVMRYIKNIEDKEATLWKESQNKQLMLQDGLDFLKGSVRENNEGMNDVIRGLIKKAADAEFRMESMNKAIENVYKLKGIDNTLALTDRPWEALKQIGTLEAQVKLLNEGLVQERQAKDTFFQDAMRQYQELYAYVHQNENNVLGKIRKHKDDVVEENRRTKEQQKKLEDIKLEKLLGDSEYLRSLVRQVENKVEEEINKRLKHEFENKNWMEQKMAILKQEIKSDEKEMLENEKKFLLNIQENMTSLNQIVMNTREQLEANLTSTQTIFNDNLKSLTKTMDAMKSNFHTKLNTFDTSVKNLEHRLDTTQKAFHEHTISINETLEKELARLEKVTVKFEQIMNENMKLQDEKIRINEENNKMWKKAFEDKNLRILTEISNALKTLKGDLLKEKTVTNERFELLKVEAESDREANKKLLDQLTDKVMTLNEQVQYKIDESYVKSSENLRHAVDNLKQNIDQMGKSALDKAWKQANGAIVTLENQQREYTDKELLKVKEELMQHNRQAVDILKTEVSGDITAIYSKISDLQNQRVDDLKSLQGDIRYTQDRLGEIRIEAREGLKILTDELDGKVKLVYQNAKIFATDRVTELRKELNEAMEVQNKNIDSAVNMLREQNNKLLHDLHETIKGEMGVQKTDITAAYEKLMEEERKVRADKDTESLNTIQSVKNMLMETIKTKIESTQALARALVNEEAAERARAIEQLTTTMKKRLDALEKYLKELLLTTVEEAKLELKELIRILDVKVEEHKVWTIKELNILVDSFEDYILKTSVQMYRDDIFFTVADKERREQWKQIEEAFQVVGAKFMEMDGVRREELEMIDNKLYEMDTKNNQDHEDLFAKIEECNEERKKEAQELLAHVEEHDKEIAELKQHCGELDTKAAELEKQTGELEENAYLMDEKFTNGLEDVDIRMQVKEYVNSLMAKTEKTVTHGEEEDKRREMKKHLKTINENLKMVDEKFDEKIDELHKTHEAFEHKTEGNFKIAEKALLAHRDFINNIDSRIHVEEMMVRVTGMHTEKKLHELEEKLVNDLVTMGHQVDLLHEELNVNMDDKINTFQKKMEEDFVQHHLLSIEDKVREMTQEHKSGQDKTIDTIQQTISAHNHKLEELEKAIAHAKEELENNIQAKALAEGEGDQQKNQHLQEEFNQKLEELDKKIREIQAGGHGTGSSDGQSNVNTGEIRTELDKFKAIIDKIQRDMADKDRATGEIEAKMEDINRNIKGIEQAVKGDIDRTYNNQNQNHQVVTDQLSKLFEQFKSLESKIEGN